MSDLSKSISEGELVEKESIVDLKKSKLKRKLLQQLYNQGNFTISHLSKHVHTSVPSVTTLIEELIHEKWIVEVGPAEVQLGRKPALYGLNARERYVLALDMTTYSSKAYILNLHNEVIFSQAIPLVIENKAMVESLTKEIRAFLQASSIKIQELEAISISMPGLINPKTGINYTYPSICAQGKSLPEELKKLLHVKTYVIHDTKAITLGEHHFGLAQNIQHAITVNMDWNGVGFGLLVNGQVVLGESGFAGELAHIQVKPQGELCYCGKVGCLDTITKASYLIKRIKELIKEGHVSLLTKENLEKIDIEMVVQAANQGDELAIDLLQDMGHEMGKVLAIAVHLLNPKSIIIHGVLANLGDFIRNPIEQAIHENCLADYKENLQVEISKLGASAKILGLQAYAIHKTLSENAG